MVSPSLDGIWLPGWDSIDFNGAITETKMKIGRDKMNRKLRNLLWYSAAIFMLSSCYWVYSVWQVPASEKPETFLSEVGEAFGTLSLWAIVFIYARTALKLLIGKGKLSERLIPEIAHDATHSIWRSALRFLNKTHVHIGIATLALFVLHIAFTGFELSNLFFVAVLVLIVWQGLFGFFLRWKYSSADLKKYSYLVHAQFASGITIGIFGWFGHLLID